VPPERLDARVDASHALPQGGEEHQVGVGPILRHAWLNIAEGVRRGERPGSVFVVVRAGSGGTARKAGPGRPTSPIAP